MNKEKQLGKLFLSFFKIGAFTFGGGYAMIPLIQHEAIENHKWITQEEMLDIVAIAESTPGVLAVNTATFVGYKIGGVMGAVMATLGVVLPSFCIISVLSYFISAFRDNQWVSAAFEGIRACVIVLMINAVRKLSKNLKKDAFNLIMIALPFVLVGFFAVPIVPILLGAAIVGIVYSLFVVNKAKGDAVK